MSKNKIKEIEQKYDMWADDFNLDPQDVECLIKQAKLGIVQQEQFHDYQTQNLRLQERVQELEHELYQDHRQEVLEGLYEQNKRYREAILLAVYELGFALDETEIDETKERILQAKLVLKNANVLEGEE